MKLAIWALVLVGAYLLYQATIGRVFADFKACYDQASEQIQTKEASQSNQCVTNKLIYDDLNSCIGLIQKKSNFEGLLYESSATKKTIDAEYAVHNENCSGNKIAPPKESFYL
ncbi:MAG: hypothetical protein COY81_02730 [Candidatus Pacebacteria bacterium CG_4_10_14_0_8_um_filter_43_12]|uniref:Uncharacterized protein n=1 Tax=Candidatus Roizmanbacteria bacterium CG10_big_fil_rev_8_21_14_0_10_45_7 TaxID=1974854 RepID=A0A2M8KV56_9BACT|nr:MAG: hypothetical protein COY81_02730 [Candidatus Pacebacteria bacterium CG_4_10_14_0_8_um_filter_43_12]PJE63789.1 MAG: hypothetical protein COU89_01420 [Candidatus Roizmanbacteria bacterium CG10_big_fil_rev_8_21_14_0_10_45_7]